MYTPETAPAWFQFKYPNAYAQMMQQHAAQQAAQQATTQQQPQQPTWQPTQMSANSPLPQTPNLVGAPPQQPNFNPIYSQFLGGNAPTPAQFGQMLAGASSPTAVPKMPPQGGSPKIAKGGQGSAPPIPVQALMSR